MLNIDLTIFPILETERLILRRLDINDLNTMYTMRTDPEVMKYIPIPITQSEEEIKQYIHSIDERMAAKECVNWAITLKEEGTMIGTIGFYRMKLEHYRAETGYMSLPKFNGKGYITEALQAIVHYGFSTMKLHSIEALLDPENIGSMKVLEKCGFIKEGHLKENWFFDGQFLDTVIYSKLNK
ncbi:GNAT family N-acetyltransferase [Myroides profundi]|uniref:Ribosomal-protein-alanine N-acetyltransferase n=1 Tax=Myroides profundi TaxID=480520 RepID=A0AAJ5BF93_MYRPR|nr:GNAT family N-acetyltransferase [Myroides profundi]AJH15693.1 alanine acetyltransferase [Myroides profundi]SER49944.1 ribosomal-protein-alanine N-acetyltransferase [Myroides profundi]